MGLVQMKKNKQPDFSAYDKEIAANKLLPFYEGVYKFEMERKDAVNARLNFPIAILTLIVGAITFFLKDIPKIDTSVTSKFFYTLIILSIPSLIATFYFFARAVFGYKYAYLRPLGVIDNIVRKLKRYNSDFKNVHNKRDIEHEITVFLLDQYQVATDINGDLNKKKLGYFRRTLIGLFITVIFLCLSIIPFVILKYSDSDDIQKVQITNLYQKKPLVIETTFDHINKYQKLLNNDAKEVKKKMGDEETEEIPSDEPPEEPIEWPSGPERRDESDVKPSELPNLIND